MRLHSRILRKTILLDQLTDSKIERSIVKPCYCAMEPSSNRHSERCSRQINIILAEGIVSLTANGFASPSSSKGFFSVYRDMLKCAAKHLDFRRFPYPKRANNPAAYIPFRVLEGK
jgi:hypothetical protein